MLKTARIVVDQYGGEFPPSKDSLKKLPGIGEYTARAILSFGFGAPHLAMDTNLQRVLGRYLAGEKKALIDVEAVEQELGSQADYSRLNAAFMDFANLVCTNRSPHCEICPLQSECRYAQTGGQLEVVERRQSRVFPVERAQTLLILHENHQRYFSAAGEVYQPFILPAPLNTRARLKSYFRREYGVELSIRPPYRQAYLDGVPTLFTRAQILLGDHSWLTYDKGAVQSWLKEAENDRIRD